MSEKTYVKHVKTGEVFEVKERFEKDSSTVWDEKGELRVFKDNMLTPYEPEEAWEDANEESVRQSSGFLEVYVYTPDTWFPVPSHYTRTITRDGKLVVQRRKANGIVTNYQA